MKINLLTFSVLISVFLSCASQHPAATQSREARIMFYNVENLFDTINDPLTADDDFTPQGSYHWSQDRYFSKLGKIRKVIKGVGNTEFPVLVGLCEIENQKVLEDLINPTYFPDNKYGIIHQDSPDERGIDVALLYDKSLFSPIKTEFIPVIFKDGDKTRDILMVKGRLGKEVITVFVNHWSSRRGGAEESEPKRIICAETIDKKVKEITQADAQAKIIVMGDFNESSADPGISMMINASGKDGRISLIDLGKPVLAKGEGSHIYDGKWSLIDQIFVSPAFQKTMQNSDQMTLHIFKPDWIQFDHKQWGKIPNRTYVRDKFVDGYSDHFPVYMIIPFQK